MFYKKFFSTYKSIQILGETNFPPTIKCKTN